jgi:hypothetical protein
LFNRGVGPRVAPITKGVPIYVHDHFGPGRHAKVITSTAKDLMEDGNEYKPMPPFTGREARVAEVENISWPELLNPVDDLPPATVITTVREEGDTLLVEGISHDNGTIARITVNGQAADVVSHQSGVVDWKITLKTPADRKLAASAADEAGNEERQTAHRIALGPKISLLP